MSALQRRYFMYGVFPKVEDKPWDGRYMPQEFETYEDAKEYKDLIAEYGIEADIEEG